ncbi:thioredoxin domain-containing protein 11 [Eupeodes corollae]|uniref:thioredoxin domain-containing protein 11 n=1 Tax=Eupeodes corollae TaxID=290404 RepID=UPI0024900CAE|nr:thioredoxin domain-containing protein 11 [Eupeodes corollae]
METIKEFGDAIGRQHDPPSFEKSIVDKSLKNLTENQSFATCGNDQAECLISNPSTSDSNSDPDNSCLSINKITEIFNNFKIIMLLQYSKECLGFIAIILTTYATLLNKEPVIGGTTSPKPIFSRYSIVQEWPYGNLADVQSKVAVSELSLIYFYAPWCAESLNAKKVYNSVANMYSQEVYFAAVNCWQPNSGCRTLYSNVYKWPVLMAYLPNALSVQYNGDWNFSSLSKFIDRLLNPFVRIHNIRELTQLRIFNDGVIFGIFNSTNTKEYQIFFQTSMKWLENDANQNIKFAVYVGENTSMFQNSEPIQAPVIKLFTPNDTIIYSKSKWTSTNLINFLKHQLADATIWVSLPNMKSATIHKYLQKGPVVVMFAPRVSPSNNYLIMKQLIYSYNNYRTDLNNSVLNEYIFEIKKEYPAMFRRLTNVCDSLKKVQNKDFQSEMFDGRSWGDSLFGMSSETVNSSKQISSNYHQRIGVVNTDNVKFCERNTDSTIDYAAPYEILRRFIQKQCVNMNQSFEKDVVEPISSFELSVFDYKNNLTLKFLMLDTMVHKEYLNNFIGNLRIPEHSSFPPSKLFIIDNDRETLHMQKGHLSTKTALEFVSDFYQGKLSRHTRSVKQPEYKNYSSDSLSISIKEINSHQFSKVINRTSVTSVVLFYSPLCPLCNIMSQTLLHTSYMIKAINVRFYRIDASANDMCWEYTMDKLPKLIVFPKNRSGDSHVFISSLQITVKNVFSFILSNLNPELQLQSLINACKLTKLSFAFQSCIGKVRGMISNEISQQLQKWDHIPSNHTQVLTRLNVLKEIYNELLRARKTEDLTFISKKILKYGSI